MEYVGGISEFNYNPIQSFNMSLKDNKAFAVPDGSSQSFEEIFESRRTPEKNDMDNFMSKISGAFMDGINSVNNAAIDAENKQEILAMGGDISAHEVMIAAEKANLSMQMGLQLRNKILAAYNELYNVRI